MQIDGFDDPTYNKSQKTKLKRKNEPTLLMMLGYSQLNWNNNIFVTIFCNFHCFTYSIS